MDKVLAIVEKINFYLSDYILIILLIGAGLYFTIRTRFVQVRCFGEGMRKVFGNFSMSGKKQKSGLSSFQALATAIAAQVGTGNIVGACGAILIGGPGAIFWMWVIAFFGMATIYAEAVLAQKTRVVHEDGSVDGGPVYYIKQAFRGKFGKFLAGFFSISSILALGFFGAMVQSNSIGDSFNTAFHIPTWIIGLIISLLAVFIFIGGVQRIGSVTEKIVPVMAGLYLVGGVIILCCRIQYIPETFGMIFKFAFAPQALVGGAVGMALKKAISQGAKRGLFSNEAGMGSTPHAHALANVKTPHDQGVVAMIGVFIDTFVVLTMTALIVISTLYAGNGVLSKKANDVVFVDNTSKHAVVQTVDYNEIEIIKDKHIVSDGKTEWKIDNSVTLSEEPKVIITDGKTIVGEIKNSNMAQWAFSGIFGNKIGNAFVAICLFFFAFSTIISWNLFGRINYNFLFGKKTGIIYSIIAIAFIFFGSILSNDLVWGLTDMFNQLMVIPNIIAIVALSTLVAKEARHSKEK